MAKSIRMEVMDDFLFFAISVVLSDFGIQLLKMYIFQIWIFLALLRVRGKIIITKDLYL